MKTYSNDIVNMTHFEEVNKIQSEQIDQLQRTVKNHTYAIFALVLLELITFILTIANM